MQTPRVFFTRVFHTVNCSRQLNLQIALLKSVNSKSP